MFLEIGKTNTSNDPRIQRIAIDNFMKYNPNLIDLEIPDLSIPIKEVRSLEEGLMELQQGKNIGKLIYCIEKENNDDSYRS